VLATVGSLLDQLHHPDVVWAWRSVPPSAGRHGYPSKELERLGVALFADQPERSEEDAVEVTGEFRSAVASIADRQDEGAPHEQM
jgi:hypothetical protein